MRLAVVLLGVFACATALKVQPKAKADDEDIDRYSHFRVQPTPTFVLTGVVTAAATALQVVKPEWLPAAACESGAGAALVRVLRTINEWKVTRPFELTMGFGVLLKAVAEVLAQVIPHASGGSVWLDPLRIVRSTIASLLSSSLTFYYWSRQPWLRALTAPRWLAAVFGKRLGTSISKMAVTQALYRPVNVFLFLLAQSFFRGDNARQMVQVLRTKFKGGLVGGIVFFACSNMLMFSVPVPFLHPILGAIAGLIFNVWLAMVAYKKVPEPAAPPAEPTVLSSLSALSPSVSNALPAVAEFPATTALLGAAALLEGAAAAHLYARAGAGAGKRPAADDSSVAPVPRTVDAL